MSNEIKSTFLLRLTKEERKAIKLKALKEDKTMQNLIQECIRTSKYVSLNEK